MKQTYFTSGEFAKLCGTTKETLRHYSNIGLLTPAKVAANGYHYYSAFQFYDYYFISTFKGTNINLKYLTDKLAESDEKIFYNTLTRQLEEIHKEQEDLAKKEKLLRRTIEKFDELYDSSLIGKIQFYECEDEYFIATPVIGKASSDKLWMETIREHLKYCREKHLDQEYQLTYCWNQSDMLAGRDETGWFICSQIQSPIDDERLHIKSGGTFASILSKGYDFTASQYPGFISALNDMGYEVCGNAYESDVSLFSPSVKTSYITETSVLVTGR